jgi:hypothetical protein
MPYAARHLYSKLPHGPSCCAHPVGNFARRPMRQIRNPARLTSFAAACSHARIQRFGRNCLFPLWRKRARGRRQDPKTRLNKFSSVDWLPHNHGFVSGLPRFRGERRSWGPAHNREGRFPNHCPVADSAHQRIPVVDLLPLLWRMLSGSKTRAQLEIQLRLPAAHPRQLEPGATSRRIPDGPRPFSY